MKRRDLLLGAASVAALAATPAARASSGELMTATDVHPPGYPTVEAVKWIGEELFRQTNGRLNIRMYHSGQLGRESDAIDMARFGAVDMTRVYAGALNNAFPLTIPLCLPYEFDSVAHLRRVLDGEVGKSVLQSFASRDLVGLAIYDSGARCFYNTQKPIVTPADLTGLKLRVPASDIFIQMLRQCGANPTPLAYGAVYSALETRLIDGAENNIRSFHSSRHFEAARYWSQSEHSYAPDVLLVSRRRYDLLSPADQQLLRDLAAQSVAVMRQQWDAGEASAAAAIDAGGVQRNDVDTEAFRTAVGPVVSQFLSVTEIARLHRLIRDAA